MENPVRVFPKRDPRTGEVYHVKFELVFDGVKRYEVRVRKPIGKTGVRFEDRFGGGLLKFSEVFYGEVGQIISAAEGISTAPYKKRMITRAWAIIREAER